jgi:hypothetical protein
MEEGLVTSLGRWIDKITEEKVSFSKLQESQDYCSQRNHETCRMIEEVSLEHRTKEKEMLKRIEFLENTLRIRSKSK